MLWLDLVSRKKGNTAKTDVSLSLDRQIRAAIDLIQKPKVMESILTGEN